MKLKVTKKFDVESIKPLLDVGHLYFGENRVQEAKDKWPNLMNEYRNIELNLIGPLQTNKIKIALDCMGGDYAPKMVVHGADRADVPLLELLVVDHAVLLEVRVGDHLLH